MRLSQVDFEYFYLFFRTFLTAQTLFICLAAVGVKGSASQIRQGQQICLFFVCFVLVLLTADSRTEKCNFLSYVSTVVTQVKLIAQLNLPFFGPTLSDSRHIQRSIYTVFHVESESAVRIDQFLHPEEKIKKNQPTGVSISYRKISYYMSPPYSILLNII